MEQNRKKGWAELAGTGKVFAFSLTQQFKSKANIISLLIFFLLSAVSVPAMALMSGGEKVTHTAIQAVYVENDTEYPLNWNTLESAYFSGLEWKTADFRLEEYETHLKDGEVFVLVAPSENGFSIDCYTREEDSLENGELEALEQVLNQLFADARVQKIGASGNQMDTLGQQVQTQVLSAEDYRNPSQTDIETQFVIQYAYAILVMMLCLISSSYVVQAIAEEKSSKLVELLMVSVRPLALLLGKVLAMMVYILVLLGVMILGFGVSSGISGRFFHLSASGGSSFLMGLDLGSIQLGGVTILVIVISMILGYLTFSIIAGLAGCCCASIEDVQGANMTVVLLVMAGYLVACVVSAFDSVPVFIASSLIPVISVFCAPVQYMLGHIGFGILLLSWAVQLLVIAFLAVFSARVYDSLIIYRGSRVRFGQLLSMARVGGGKK